MKSFNLFILTITLLACGCAGITREQYFSPVNGDGVKGRDSSLNHPIITTGKGNLIIINRPNLTIEIEDWNVSSKLLAIGPLYFPIIPTFAIPNLSKRTNVKSKGQITLRLSFRFSDNIEIDVSQIKLIVAGDKEFSPVAYEYERAISGREYYPTEIIMIGKHGNTRESLYVHYPVSIDTASFQLLLSGIKIGGEKVTFPIIQYKKVSGYSFGLEP